MNASGRRASNRRKSRTARRARADRSQPASRRRRTRPVAEAQGRTSSLRRATRNLVTPSSRSPAPAAISPPHPPGAVVGQVTSQPDVGSVFPFFELIRRCFGHAQKEFSAVRRALQGTTRGPRGEERITTRVRRPGRWPGARSPVRCTPDLYPCQHFAARSRWNFAIRACTWNTRALLARVQRPVPSSRPRIRPGPVALERLRFPPIDPRAPTSTSFFESRRVSGIKAQLPRRQLDLEAERPSAPGRDHDSAFERGATKLRDRTISPCP